MTDVETKVKAIVADILDVDESQLAAEANFIDDLGADSMDVVELVIEFEKRFNLSIPDEDAFNIQTVGEAVVYVEKMLNNI